LGKGYARAGKKWVEIGRGRVREKRLAMKKWSVKACRFTLNSEMGDIAERVEGIKIGTGKNPGEGEGVYGMVWSGGGRLKEMGIEEGVVLNL
jgi:hypothetical protein